MGVEDPSVAGLVDLMLALIRLRSLLWTAQSLVVRHFRSSTGGILERS
jgi:hypothetical protein